eukprot:Hpha_TRINITY_DN16797_c5_g6::TRINITY_DN16797_c5_g6_i1::g.79042::m.79042
MGCGASKAHDRTDDTLVIVVGSANSSKTPGNLHARSMSLVRMDMHKLRQAKEAGAEGDDLLGDILSGQSDGHLASPSARGGLGLGGSFRHRRRTIRMHEFSETVGQLVQNNSAATAQKKGIKSPQGTNSAVFSDDEVRKRLDKLFALMDVDASGAIGVDELQEGFKKIGWAHSPQAVTRMFGLKSKDAKDTQPKEIDRATFDKLFRSITKIEDLVIGAEMDQAPAEITLPSAPRREWKAGTRPLVGHKTSTHLGFRTRAKALALSPVARIYVASQRDETNAQLHSLDDGTCHRILQGHQHAILSVAVSSDRKHIATASKDGLLILFDATCGHVLKQLEHPGVVTCCSFTPNGKHVYTGCHDGSLRKYDVARGRLLACTDLQSPNDLDVVTSMKGIIVSIVAAPRACIIARARDKKCEVYDSESLNMRHQLQGHETQIRSLAFSTEHKAALSLCEKFLRIWDIRVGMLERAWRIEDIVRKDPAPGPPPSRLGGTCACFCPGDFAHLIAVAALDCTVRLIRNAPGEGVLLTIYTRVPVHTLSSSREFTELVFGDDHGNIHRLQLW